MTIEEYLYQLKKNLNKLSEEEIKKEVEQIKYFIENGKSKNISDTEIIKSLGTVEDTVKAIYLKRGIKITDSKMSIKDTFILICINIKKNFISKDKKVILQSIGRILYTVFVAIIIKVPFIFLKTLLLDFLNNNDIQYTIQNVVSGCFEIIYLVIAIIIIYKNLKKYFGKY